MHLIMMYVQVPTTYSKSWGSGCLLVLYPDSETGDLLATHGSVLLIPGGTAVSIPPCLNNIKEQYCCTSIDCLHPKNVQHELRTITGDHVK